VILTRSLEPILSRLPEQGRVGSRTVPTSQMCLAAESASLRARICFTNLSVTSGPNGAPSVHNGSGYMLLDPHP
jgi:hypothetical protein